MRFIDGNEDNCTSEGVGSFVGTTLPPLLGSVLAIVKMNVDLN